MQKIAGPAHGRVWALPVALNFILGGTAAGYYCLWTLAAHAKIVPAPGSASGGLLAILLVAAGFAALALESGRPLRARYLLNHWKSSWMSRETIAGMVFIVAVIIDVFTPSSLAAIVAAGAAIAFLLSQGMMVFRCTAVTVWRDPVIPVSFIASGLAAGYGLILFSRLGLMLPPIRVAPYIDTIGCACILINLATWGLLVRRRNSHAIQAGSGRLRLLAALLIMGGGQMFPLMLLLSVRPWSVNAAGTVPLFLTVFAALAILAGNCAQKLWLVRMMQQVCGMRLDGEESPLRSIRR